MKTPCRATLLAAAFAVAGTIINTAHAQNLFVSSLGTSSVWEFGQNGNLINSAFAANLPYPEGVALDKNGNVYVAFNDQPVGGTPRVEEFGPGGNVINASFAKGFYSPAGITFDPSGN